MSLLDRLAAKTHEAEVYEARSDTLEVRFANGAVKGALARESSGIAVRAIRDGKLGFAGSTDRTHAAESRLVDNLLSSIAMGDKAGFSFPAKLPARTTQEALAGYDEKTAKLAPKDLVGLGETALHAIKEKHPEVALDITVSRGTAESKLENSRGARCEERGTYVSVGIEVNRTTENDVLLFYDGFTGVSVGDELDLAIARTLEKLDRAKRDVKLERPGKLPVLFSPSGSLVVWGPVFQGLSGKSVLSGTSPIREKLGQKIFDSRVELVDDGILAGLLGSSCHDDEGIPRRSTHLVRDGVLASFVHDLKTASATKQEPTGNGARGGVLGAPGPSFSNLLIRGGSRSQDELLRSIGYGLLVESVIGRGQGNTISGAFSNTVGIAYLVEKGEVVGRLKDVSIAGNAYEILKDGLGELGREQQTSF